MFNPKQKGMLDGFIKKTLQVLSETKRLQLDRTLDPFSERAVESKIAI